MLDGVLEITTWYTWWININHCQPAVRECVCVSDTLLIVDPYIYNYTYIIYKSKSLVFLISVALRSLRSLSFFALQCHFNVVLCHSVPFASGYKYFAPQAEHIEAAMATLPGLSEARHFCSHIQHSLTQWYDGSNWCAIVIWTWIHKFLFDSVCHSINLAGVAMQKCWWKWLKMVYPKLVFKVSLIGLIKLYNHMQ